MKCFLLGEVLAFFVNIRGLVFTRSGVRGQIGNGKTGKANNRAGCFQGLWERSGRFVFLLFGFSWLKKRLVG